MRFKQRVGSKYLHSLALVVADEQVLLQHLAVEIEAKQIAFGAVANFDALERDTLVGVAGQDFQ